MGAVVTDSQFHVLAVDDSIIDRKLIERLLKTSSYQVLTAANFKVLVVTNSARVTAVDSGSKALELLGLLDDEKANGCSTEQHVLEVNLIITDYCMPGMTGYDLLRKIKESSSLKDIPVVIMSSENVPSRISRCLEDGAYDFFLKPVKQSDVNKLRPHLLRGKARESVKDQEQLQQPPTPTSKRKIIEESLLPEPTRTRFQ
ncbi:unnamed protein product [Coffea canephora]|uniref:DH200=94 genomic scaffold, scaffold_2362 n=1 Tax=Coffea canephora TaxID=49390 RepID=A0A068VKA0_COFCA|nr:unnamed protein product [Coffea canephora]